MRHADLNALRVRIEEERWDRELERREEEDSRRGEQERKQRLLDACSAPLHKHALVASLGGGEVARKWADLYWRVAHNLPPPAPRPVPSEPVKVDPAESKPIKPDQSV